MPPLLHHFSSLRCALPPYRKILLFQLFLVTLFFVLTLFAAPYLPLATATDRSGVEHENRHLNLARCGGSFGGYDTRPQTERCYKQEKVATLLSVFLGWVGADQWYARHWILAVFKTFTGGGILIWSVIDICFWIVGGFYSTPGCGGGCKKEWVC